MSSSTTVPICTRELLQATLTLPWFVDHAEYAHHPGSFQMLVNGEEAFSALHYTLAKAKRNICLICWGFQPSMYLVRKGSDMIKYPTLPEPVPAQLGKLLVHKAKQGVKVRVLCFAAEPLGASVNVSSPVIGESPNPGRGRWRVGDRPGFETEAQYAYDRYWYTTYDPSQRDADSANPNSPGKLQGFKAADPDVPLANLVFHSRGFDKASRDYIFTQPYMDKQLAFQLYLAVGPSHHQKMALIDYDDAQRHVGFVMGHNLLDEYWDTNAHSAKRHADPRQGRNGIIGPREDFSALVTGKVVGDLFFNFNKAWQQETGSGLPVPAGRFSHYLPRLDRANPPAMLQLLRTQPEYQRKDIMRAYFQMVNNVTSYIYIENQYFRWQPLADKIKQAAQGQLCRGRKTPIYLFAITNSSDDGIGAGTVSTYRMLDSLGRADTIPTVARLERADDQAARLGQAKQRLAEARFIHRASPQLASSRQDVEQATREVEAAQQAYEAASKPDVPIPAVEQPGLKVHICTLVAMDSGPAQPATMRRIYNLASGQTITVTHTPAQGWTEVYIHAKLMLVNDCCMTLGSANINSRSMESDSELNILHDNSDITRALRRQLWGRHTHNFAGANPPSMGKEEVSKVTFEVWEKLLKANKFAESHQQPPIAPLREFLRSSPLRTNHD
ncbi:phospholipase D-like domain-containing protein [Aquitalea magnusonii]|uniref:Phospholipase D-like protein n=1 Tax=Aquitalea magnusonii TaxID=332411 RepID=A0A318IY46_9NEIS|nr:phospholipase D-like domain-containing protein [Aquitalea magnusonii]PXX40124.1 phospholipase D-like protein [Aquitalea magnusonii]